MNPSRVVTVCILAGSLGWGGCVTTTPPPPPDRLPITYRVPVGNPPLASSYWPEEMNVKAVQDISVSRGKVVYYQVVSPVPVTVYIYEKTGVEPGGANLLGQVEGTSFSAALKPNTAGLEFVFADGSAVHRGSLQFTVTDRPPGAPVALSARN
jgi:hypothetical protein